MTVTREFSGISDPNNYPPENALAVSLGYIVTSESSKIEWTNLTGGQAVNESLYTLFASLPSSQRNSLLDVRVAFDSVNQRFVIMAENLGSNASNIDIAVSKDANPNDGWWVGSVSSLLTINGSTSYADMPYLSVDGTNIYVSEPQYGSGMAGTQEWVFSDSIYNGGSLTTVKSQVAPASQGIARNVSGANGLTYYVSVVPTGGQSVLTLQTYNSATKSFSTAITLQLHNSDRGPGSLDYTIAQMGTSLLLDAYDSRIASLAYANGYLYGLSEVKPSSSSVPEIHWFKIDVTTNPNAPTVVAQGDITGAAIGSGVGVFNGSLAVDAAGDLIVNFNASSANMYPADYYVYEAAGGSTFSAPIEYKASTGFFNSGASGAQRWGTYSTSVADPGNPNGFWISSEYVANKWWQTSIAQISIPSVQGVLAGSVVLSSATEDTALATGPTVASFTDSNPADVASSFTATITWGDGSTSLGTVSGANGAFSVAGGHLYADEGSFALAVAITDTADNAQITPTGTVVAAEADVLTPHAVTLTGTAGQALSNVTVASFSDTDTATPASDLTATIAWGDGTTSTGTVSGSNGNFSVSGSHTYTAPASNEPVTVTLSDDAPGTANAIANSSAQISAPDVLTGNILLNAATEDTALVAGTILASFTDSNTVDTASSFTATITWGDGSISSGSISGANGAFSVAGGHLYADEGSFALAVAITDIADNAQIAPTGTFVVAEADVLTPHAVTLTGTAGQALSNVTVASFSDTDTATPASDLTATIAWGDGTTSFGTVSGSNGNFSVSGSHTYTAPASNEPVTVTLNDDAPGTATATANSTANITAPGVLLGSEQLSSATEDTALAASTTVASFTDSNTADTASVFTASVTWGDGSTSPGTVSGSNGTFTVAGGHTYAEEGNYVLSVAITNTADNAQITTAGTVVVADADVLTPHAVTLSGAVGQVLSNVTVATFSDADTTTPASGLNATIVWGDGGTSSGIVSGSNGSFSVTGTHTYTAPGNEPVTVTLSDDAPGTATATADSTANITAPGVLAGNILLSAATEDTALAMGTSVASFTDTNTADTASVFTATITWGDGSTSPGTVSGSNGTFTVAVGHTYADEGNDVLSVAITDTADNVKITPAGTIVVADADVLTPHAVTLNATVGQALSNVTVATFSDADTTTPASGLNATIVWGDGTTSPGTVSGSNGSFSVIGTHTYTAPGNEPVTVTLSDDAPGTATAAAKSTANVTAPAGLIINNATTGPISLSSAPYALTITTTGTITSTGASSDGVDGSSTNPSTITNGGAINATGTLYSAGVWLPDGGAVTNNAGATILGAYAVDVTGGSATVVNNGTITGSREAVYFSGTGTDRLVVGPYSVINGKVVGGTGSNTLELAGGQGSIAGLSNGAGTITENGSWSFTGFQTITVDSAGTWSLNGGKVATIADNGTINVKGSLDVSSAIDPASAGLFLLNSGATLEVAAALGTATQIGFMGSSRLKVDSATAFGTNVGTASYAGPLLEAFGAGGTIDLLNFANSGVVLNYGSTANVLQITNSASKVASFKFDTVTLGGGSFHTASDGGTGMLITRS